LISKNLEITDVKFLSGRVFGSYFKIRSKKNSV